MIPRILLSLFAVVFLLVSNAAAQCPGLFPLLPARRVVVVHRYAVAPVVSVPVIESPAIVAPAPAVSYYQAAPMAAVVAAGPRPHASRKAAHHTAKAAYHTARAAYWATRM